jgi:hypothetical protein
MAAQPRPTALLFAAAAGARNRDDRRAELVAGPLGWRRP